MYIGSNDVTATELNEVTEDHLDIFLEERNVPFDVIDELTYYGKLEIYNTLDADAVFDSYANEDVVLEDDSLGLQPFTIPKSQLDLRVSRFRNSDGTYSFYPSFIWNVRSRLRNDTFGFVLDSNNWTTVAGNVGLTAYVMNYTPGNHDSIYYDRATTSDYAEHAFKIPSNHFTTNYLHHEGHTHFRARPRGSSIDRRMILKYGDDTRSVITSASYGISFGIFNLSFSNTPSGFRETNETLSWE